jgi:hypothetical protein
MDPLGSIPDNTVTVEERKSHGNGRVRGEWRRGRVVARVSGGDAIRERVGVSGGDAVRAGVRVGVRGKKEGREE